MSQRHRSADETPLPSKADVRAHAHGERHRIRTELQSVAEQVSAGIDPADIHEPGPAWVVPEHSRFERTWREGGAKVRKHWKLKMWKRRTSLRIARAKAFNLVGRQP